MVHNPIHRWDIEVYRPTECQNVSRGWDIRDFGHLTWIPMVWGNFSRRNILVFGTFGWSSLVITVWVSPKKRGYGELWRPVAQRQVGVDASWWCLSKAPALQRSVDTKFVPIDWRGAALQRQTSETSFFAKIAKYLKFGGPLLENGKCWRAESGLVVELHTSSLTY